jgi:hypothetical protein
VNQELRPQQPAPWWLWPQILCLDAPAVVLAWLAALAHTHRVHLMVSTYAALGLATWVIYLLDRTGDALSGRLPKPLSHRHAFCHRHQQRLLGVLLPIVGSIVLWLAFWRLPQLLLMQSMALAMFAALYLALHASPGHGRLHLGFTLAAALAGGWLLARIPLPDWRLPMMPVLEWPRSALRLLVVWLAFQLWRGQALPHWRALVPKELLASLLLVLGCAVCVHVWALSDHGLLCRDTALLWMLALLNLLIIKAAEQPVSIPSPVLSWWQCSLSQGWLCGAGIAGSLIIAWRWPGGHTLGLAVASAVSSALLLALHLWRKRLALEALHVLADVALVVPLPLVWWLARER